MKVSSLERQAAVDKIPLYKNFEANLTPKDIEKMVIRNYRDAVPGTLKIDTKPKGSVQMGYVDFEMDSAKNGPRYYRGSVIISLEVHGQHVRSYAYVRIDG